ncbi:hypothetical protein SAMN03097699_1197 [Flavobacteriaceae bacterium MAR_2010_188]|nr:hypothetical protein SAMN03097699_1197 [Flavobacteriaceae bacterium MAR_2010_188]
MGFRKKSRSISRILYRNINASTLIIYLRLLLPATFSCLPSNIGRATLSVGLHGIAPHRVYLVSLQHYLYILSVALFLTSRPVAVNHYAALWCSDFPHKRCSLCDKAICFAANLGQYILKLLHYC